MSIEVRNISKTFGVFNALRDVSLRVETGELVALLGPSGSGKTTLLRIVAGLDRPDSGSGSILFHDEDVARRNASDRRVGFVFQHYALFRHMTVFENIAFGLRVRPRAQRPDKSEIADRVHRLLQLIQLEPLGNRYPTQLSGGQRQRVALARALAVEPKVLLLDEPFGALDAKVRQDLRQWLRRLHDEIHVTSVFVTHDQEEALEVANRVVVMNAGRIEQVGTPEEVFHQPANAFVMNFLGNVNVFEGRVDGNRTFFGPLPVDDVDPRSLSARMAARGFVRPHELDLARDANGHPSFAAHVMHVNAAGPHVKVELVAADGRRVHVELPQEKYQELQVRRGEQVYVTPRSLRIFMEDYVI
jgi:sulfate transport system ATP-binding protein